MISKPTTRKAKPPVPSKYQARILGLCQEGAWLFLFPEVEYFIMVHSGEHIRAATSRILRRNKWVKKGRAWKATNGNVVAFRYHISKTSEKALDRAGA